MKPGAAWYGFRFQTPSNYFEMAAALGLKYVEIPLYGQVLSDLNWDYRVPETKGAESGRQGGIEGIRAAAQEAGVTIVSGVAAHNIAGQLRGDRIDRTGVELGLAASRRAIEIGAQLGIKVIRLSEPVQLATDQLHMEEPYMEAFGEAFRILGDYAVEHGIRIAIENFGLTADQINRVLDAADHPAVGTLFDPCNYYRHGQDPLASLKSLKDRVYYCHLKDAWFPYPGCMPDQGTPAFGHDGSIPPWWWIRALGEGNVQWEPILTELASFYEGYACFEHDIADDIMRSTRAGIAYVRRIAQEHHLPIEI